MPKFENLNEQAVGLGREARDRGVSLRSCPFPPTQQHLTASWKEGWRIRDKEIANAK